MTHTRIRKFNTRDTYPEQNLDNDLCQAVVARGTMVRLPPISFSCVSSSEMTAATVTSEPVPAVVGMAKSGSGRFTGGVSPVRRLM